MHLVLDALLIVVVGICVVVGWRRGFIKSARGLVSMILAVILVATLSQPVGEKIDEAMIRPWTVDQIISLQGEEISVDAPIGQLDLVAINEQLSSKFGVDILGIGDMTADLTVGEYVDRIIADSGITMGVSRALAAVLLFVGTSLVVWLICLILTPILKLPVLRQCNGLLGMLIGVVNAAIILMVLATAVRLFGSTPQGAAFGPQVVEQTLLFQYIDQLNPIANWIIK